VSVTTGKAMGAGGWVREALAGDSSSRQSVDTQNTMADSRIVPIGPVAKPKTLPAHSNGRGSSGTPFSQLNFTWATCTPAGGD